MELSDRSNEESYMTDHQMKKQVKILNLSIIQQKIKEILSLSIVIQRNFLKL